MRAQKAQSSLLQVVMNYLFNTKSGPLNNGNVRLFKQPWVPSPDLDLTTLVEADFPGYARQPTLATGVVPAWAQNGLEAEFNIAPVTFTGGAIVTPQAIYGYGFDNATILRSAQLFNKPVAMIAMGDTLSLNALRFGFNVLWLLADDPTGTHA